MASKFVSRAIYLLGLLVLLSGIAVVLYGAQTKPAPTYGPPLVWAGFAIGLLGLAITARGATLRRY